MNKVKAISFVVVAVCLTSFAFAGDIAGKVSFEGKAPKRLRIQMGADAACMKQHKEPAYSEDVIINKNGTLKDVLIYVKDGLSGKTYEPPKDKVVFAQKGCMYSPHVMGIQVGQDFEVINDDPTLHNVHSLSKLNPQFNIGQPKQGMKYNTKFVKPEIFKVKCEVHSWMHAYIGVFSHPFFAVTGDDGSFDLKNLPAGTYTVEAWHEKYGTQTAKVTVDAAGKKTVDFKFAGK
jgi:plastocyanin